MISLAIFVVVAELLLLCLLTYCRYVGPETILFICNL